MYRDTWMSVDLDAIADNVKVTKEICGKKYIAVLKADAYGCGDSHVARAVIEAGADMLAVSSLDEAVMLRNEGFHEKILILGPVNADDVDVLIRYGISTAAYSMEFIKAAAAKGCKGLLVHLAVDTGMNRIGFKTKKDLKEAFDLLQQAGAVIEGIFTHFYRSDDFDHVVTNQQYAKFKDAVTSLNYPFWVKNINPFTRDEHDVAFISSEKDFEAYRQESESRHDISTIAEEHIEGDLIKFYGVGEGFFYYYYPTSDQSFRGKFNNESVNGAPHNISFDKEELLRLCGRASGVIGLPVYGGDAVIGRDGNIYIVDFNDFPSFGACRKMAAKAIADYIETKYF